jgi:cytochrome c oxidase subunit 1
VFLTLLGFGLGAAIRGSNTMVPAHYHAAVGAVTVAFMAVTGPILKEFGFKIGTRRLRRAFSWQPVMYGGGMLLFAGGFALAGVYGMGRKVYGAEQAERGLGGTIGLGTMGIGGLVAIAGGLLFLWIVGMAWMRGGENGSVSKLVG